MAEPAPPQPTAAQPALLLRLADALGWPLLVLSAAGRVEQANSAGQAVLDAAVPVFCAAAQDGRVLPSAPSAATGFKQAVQQAARGETVTLALPAAVHEGLPLAQTAVCIASLQPLLSDGEAAQPGRVLLSLDTHRRLAPDLHGYAQALTLTPAQARVLRLLGHGLRPAQIAAVLGIAASTARGHLTTLRRKTGYRSTADLIMAMQRLPPCVAAPAARIARGEDGESGQ